MAAQQTRRGLLAVVPSFAIGGAALASLKSTAQASPMRGRDAWPEFIHALGFMHPEGRKMGLKAAEAGLKAEDCCLIMLDDRPFLMFRQEGGKLVSVGPKGVF